MNKQERKIKGQFKFKKRLKNYQLLNSEFKHYSLKTTGKPCSCYMCSPKKIQEKSKYRLRVDELGKLK